jgi:hypothetical protein
MLPNSPGAGGGDTGGGSAAGCLDTMPAAGFWIPLRGMLELCRGLIGHIGPTKTSELKTTSSAPGSCRYQPICTPVGTRQLSPQK